MSDNFDSLYFLNCIRNMPVFPLEEKDSNKWIDLKPIVQGRRTGEYMRAKKQAEEINSEITDGELTELYA